MGKRKGRKPAAKPSSGGVGSEPPPPASEAEAEAELETEGEAGEDSDLCFACKDGGDLRFCDYSNCHKAYHHYCVGKDEDFLNSDEDFICRWHTCFICNGCSYFRCLCCPGNSVCRGCLKQAKFAQVGKQTKGFCANCLRMAIMIEKNIEVDSDGERVDFSDRSTCEFLFKDYWEIVKEKEGLTLDNLQEAHACLVSDPENFPRKEHSSDDDFLGNTDDERIRPCNVNGKSKKVKAIRKQGKSKKIDYDGWGSRKLIGFLESIGVNTSKSLDQFGAAEAVKEYIRQKDLWQKDKQKHVKCDGKEYIRQKDKKTHVECDGKLKPLFGRSVIKFTKIYSLLEQHMAGNATSEDETLSSSEDNNDSVRKKKTRTMIPESSTSKEISERIRRCFASLVRDNIKLIYLRRSLVMDLLKQPETFQSKVIGCFVRVKNDPKGYYYHKPKTLYYLGQVTGFRKSSEKYKIRDISTDMLLCISSTWAEVKISMLSDEDFEEDECEDLRLLVQKEHLERHTVAELEDKARSVHSDIVNHWIDKELQRLEKKIEVANEKGWRYEMHECIDKRQLLRKPEERQRLLEEASRVIPDLEDNKDAELFAAASGKSFQMNTALLEGANERAVCLESCSDGANEKAGSFKSCSEEKSEGASGERAVCLKSCSMVKSKGANEERASYLKSCSDGKPKAVSFKSCSEEKSEGANEDRAVCFKSCPEENPKVCLYYLQSAQYDEAPEAEVDADTPGTCVQKQGTTEAKSNAAGDTPRVNVQNQGNEGSVAGDKLGMRVQKQANTAGITVEVINIDDDEDEPMHDEGANILVVDLDAVKPQDTCMAQPETRYTGLWYYMDPQDDEQGPFTIDQLRGWKDYFDDDFRVWRAGQSCDSAILLKDALLLKR